MSLLRAVLVIAVLAIAVLAIAVPLAAVADRTASRGAGDAGGCPRR